MTGIPIDIANIFGHARHKPDIELIASEVVPTGPETGRGAVMKVPNESYFETNEHGIEGRRHQHGVDKHTSVLIR